MQIEPNTETKLSQLKRAIVAGFNWHPEPLSPPATDKNLSEMSGLERSVESIRYSILSAEFWISPDGVLRQWLRFNLRILGFLGIPAVVLMPVLTFLLSQFTSWTRFLVQIAMNLAIGVLWIVAGVALLSLLGMVIQRLTSR